MTAKQPAYKATDIRARRIEQRRVSAAARQLRAADGYLAALAAITPEPYHTIMAEVRAARRSLEQRAATLGDRA